MRRSILRELRAHAGRVTMMLVAIVIGVAFVVGTWVLSDSAAAVQAQVRSDLAVRVVPANGQLTEEQRGTLAAVPGVSAATGVRTGYAALITAAGTVVGSAQPDYGATSWDASQRFTVDSGRAPTGAAEVALSESLASQAAASVGSTVKVLLANHRVAPATVVGLFSYHPTSGEASPAVAYDEATARSLLGEDYQRVELFGADPSAIAAAAGRVLGPNYDIRTAADLTAQAEADAKSDATTIRKFLLVFAAVALLVAMFVIANTFTMLVAQRTRQFALLRAVGASRRQVRRSVLAEAAVLGGLGAAAGVGLGIGLGAAMVASLDGVTLAVRPGAVLIGLVTGIVMTLLSSYGPVHRAATVAPVAALRTDATLPRRSLVIRYALGSLALAVGVTAVLMTAGEDLTDLRRVVGMSGALVAWSGVLLLAPALVTALLRPVTNLGRSRQPPVLKMALGNATRDPRRTAATASALMIGLALVCAFATVGSTFAAAYTAGLKVTVPEHTLVVQPALTDGVLGPGGLDDATIASVTGVSTADNVTAESTADGHISDGPAGRPEYITRLDATAIGRILTPDLVTGTADITTGVLVPQASAADLGVHVGDRVTLSTPDGTAKTLPVSGVYKANVLLYGVLVGADQWPAGPDFSYTRMFASGPTREALQQAISGRPDLVVRDRTQLIDEVLAPLGQLRVIYALLGAAVLISVFGVVNTLALSVLERTREIGILRAVGASRGFVRRNVQVESVIIATYGGLLGVVVGLLLGGVMQHLLLSQSILDIAVPYSTVVIALVGMVGIGVLAALWPSHRATQTNILTAITPS